LFDYITSQEFVQNNIADTIAGRGSKLEDQNAVSEEIEPSETVNAMLVDAEEVALPQNLQDAEQILNPALFKSKTPEEPVLEETKEEDPTPEAELQLGKPIPFTKKEKHSFTEWLKLTSKHDAEEPQETQDVMEELEKKKKFELLDKFIENNPKIVPTENANAKVNIKESTKFDKNELMTETLAKVYLEQKKYKKAIQSFKILSLKYPEKSGFFADQIRAVKKLQKEKE
jgi:predicted Zn-dependent protease